MFRLSSRFFSSSGIRLANFDPKAMRAQMDKTLQLFSSRIKDIKSGSTSANRFSGLELELDHGKSQVLKNIATVAQRGNKVSIVAFDPRHVKYIQTAIVGQLGLPAEPSPKDHQSLNVIIPPATTDKKAETHRLIKDAYEQLRHSSHRQSLATIRHKYISPLKKQKGTSQSEQKKDIAEVENTTKIYNQKLEDIFKRA